MTAAATGTIVGALIGGGWVLAGWVGDLPRTVFLVMAGFLAAMAGLSGFVAWRTWRVGRWIGRAVPATAAGTETGLVVVEGRAEATPKALKAYISGVPCCWCRWKIEECVRSGDGGGGSSRWEWRVVSSGESERPIILTDATGQCAVDPAGADVFPTDRTVWHGSEKRPLSPPPTRGSPGDRPMTSGTVVVMGQPSQRFRYTEECLYAGDPLCVVGWRGEPATRPGAGTALDTDESNGDIDPCDIGGDAEEEEEIHQPPVPGALPHRLGRPPAGRGILAISALSREKTVAMHRHGVIGAGIIALLLLAVLGWFLGARFP